MRDALGELLDQDRDAELSWTQRRVHAAGFATHMRSEDALHRWDLVGDDDLSTELLAQPDLLEHAVSFIGRPLCERGRRRGAADQPMSARIRSTG